MTPSAQQDVLWKTLTLVLILAAWQFLAARTGLTRSVLPGPADVLVALYEGFLGFARWDAGLVGVLTDRAGLYYHTGITLAEVGLGSLAGTLVAVALALLMARFPVVQRTIYPFLVTMQAMPRVAVAPLFIIWFGYGITSKAVLVALVVIFPILVNLISGMHAYDREASDLLASLRASRWQVVCYLMVPSALPYLFAGLEIALVFALVTATVGEFIGARDGLGAVMVQANYNLDVARVFAVLITLGAIGLLMVRALQSLRSRLLFWYPAEKPLSEVL